MLFHRWCNTIVYHRSDKSRKKMRAKHCFFGQNQVVCGVFLDGQAGQYRKKAPARRRERRKRDNEQELKCKIGYSTNTILCRWSQVEKLDFFWKIYDRFFTITTPRPSSKGESRSRYKGLAWDRRDRMREVRISVNGKRIYIGRFTDQMKAARAYDKAAKKYHGRIARVNLKT